MTLFLETCTELVEIHGEVISFTILRDIASNNRDMYLLLDAKKECTVIQIIILLNEAAQTFDNAKKSNSHQQESCHWQRCSTREIETAISPAGGGKLGVFDHVRQ